jgi:hypothetical protein
LTHKANQSCAGYREEDDLRRFFDFKIDECSKANGKAIKGIYMTEALGVHESDICASYQTMAQKRTETIKESTDRKAGERAF